MCVETYSSLVTVRTVKPVVFSSPLGQFPMTMLLYEMDLRADIYQLTQPTHCISADLVNTGWHESVIISL